MNVTYRLRSNELTDSFFNTIKDTFRNKDVAITVEEIEDDTSYLSKLPATHKEIVNSLESLKANGPVHVMTMKQLEALVQ